MQQWPLLATLADAEGLAVLVKIGGLLRDSGDDTVRGVRLH